MIVMMVMMVMVTVMVMLAVMVMVSFRARTNGDRLAKHRGILHGSVITAATVSTTALATRTPDSVSTTRTPWNKFLYGQSRTPHIFPLDTRVRVPLESDAVHEGNGEQHNRRWAHGVQHPGAEHAGDGDGGGRGLRMQHQARLAKLTA